jgi:catechol 2,3-dioxygenase-like lactoylglutathione lyase family enzyme
MMHVQGVLETCLYAEDLEPSTRFYAEVLGLEIVSSVAGRHVFFRVGRGVFLLFDPGRTGAGDGEVPAHGARGPGHVAFAVDPAELPQWRERLARHRIEVEAEVTWPRGGSSLYVRDPAGNSVELTSPQIWGIGPC